MSIEAIAIALNHSRAKGTAKLVLIGIANHLGPDAHEGAWPSQQRLANYANVSDRAVRNALEELVQLGEIRYETAQGISKDQYKPNRYWLTLRCPDFCDRSMGHNRVEEFVSRVETFDNQGGNILQSGWKPVSDKPEDNLNKNRKENTLSDLFHEFWKEYPRKDDKALARKAFRKALNIARFEDILAGVIRYANDPNLPTELQFVKKAHTWLAAEAWENGPLPFDSRASKKREQSEQERILKEWGQIESE